jgi:predicted kinase
MKSIVLLSGPVGSGKTTIAPLLAASSPGPAAHIEGDKFWFFFAKDAAGMGRKRNFQIIMRSMTAASLPFAISGYEVILDFSIPPWFLDTVRKIAERREVPLDLVILRPSESVCAARAAARAEGTISDYTPYHDFYADFDAPERHIVADDQSDATQIAARIREGLSEGKFRLT